MTDVHLAATKRDLARALLTAVLAVVFTAACSGQAIGKGRLHRHATPPASQRAPLAVSAMNGFSLTRLPQPQLELQLTGIELNHVRVVRSDAAWADIEPLPPGPLGPVWQFSQTDAWVRELALHHLTWEPIIDYAVGWAKTCSGFCPPSSDTTYATFAQAVAARYGAGGTFWSEHPELPYYPAQIFEIWNEENTPTYWSTGPDPAQYASLYLAARSAIRAVDPTAEVIIGGLAEDGGPFDPGMDVAAQFVQQMFASDPALYGNVDGFGLHPYGTTARDVAAWVAHFRQALIALGEGSAPIDVTEFGWTTGPRARETWRGWMMLEAGLFLSHSNCGVRLLAPYDWINPGLLHEFGSDYGLVNRSGIDPSMRLAGTTWFRALTLAAAKRERALCGPA